MTGVWKDIEGYQLIQCSCFDFTADATTGRSDTNGDKPGNTIWQLKQILYKYNGKTGFAN